MTWQEKTIIRILLLVAGLLTDAELLTPALLALAREALEARGKVCGTCRHQLTEWHRDDPGCGLTRMTDGVHPTVTIVPCRFLGNTCGSWAAKEDERGL